MSLTKNKEVDKQKLRNWLLMIISDYKKIIKINKSETSDKYCIASSCLVDAEITLQKLDAGDFDADNI